MKKKRIISTLTNIVSVIMLLIAACSSSSDNSSTITDPYEKQDISGVWLGYLGNLFVIGMITEEVDDSYSALLVGQETENLKYMQFISPDDMYLTQTPYSAIFSGYLEDFYWDTNRSDYRTLLPEKLLVLGTASTKNVFGSPLGTYTYGSKQETGIIVLYYNTTYDVAPNINNIQGEWEITDAMFKGNTISMTIKPYTSNTIGASISGRDNRGNVFDGTIAIHYSPMPKNLYDVYIRLNNTINLNGLAAYVLESSTEGITVSKKTLAIGAISNDKAYSLQGFAGLKQQGSD